MREGFVTTQNGKIWYAVYGENRTRTPLLVLHGGPGFLSMSEGLETLWEDRPVYFYDQLGCGNSDRAADADFYSVERYVAELAEVRRALTPGTCRSNFIPIPAVVDFDTIPGGATRMM